MNSSFFQSALPGWQWGLLALVPPAILALYFLKLKRQPLEVPSTYLWKKSLEDLHVNSLWQRLRKSLLLFLQLLLVLLAILSLLRPGWQTLALQEDRFILMIDNSASMQATDVEDSRLAQAIQKAHGVIDRMSDNSEAMIITFAGRPQIIQEFTTNKALLRDRVDSIGSTNESTQLIEALELAGSLANPKKVAMEGTEFSVVEDRPAELFIISDGRFARVADFSLGNLSPHFIPVGSVEASNLAVTALATGRNEILPEQSEVFAEVANYTSEELSVSVDLFVQEQFRDARALTIDAQSKGIVTFPLLDNPIGELRVKLSGVSSDDQLALDDQGFAAINEPRTGKVLLITPGNPPLEKVLSTDALTQIAETEVASITILRDPSHQRAVAEGAYDLIIHDRCRPQGPLPRCHTIFIGASSFPSDMPAGDTAEESTPEAVEESTNEVQKSSVILVDWRRSHPLMSLIELGDVLVAESYLLEIPPGGQSLIDAEAGSIFAVRPREQFEDAVFGFEIVGIEDGQTYFNTDWPLRQSFPSFWFNALSYFVSGGATDITESTRPGEVVELALPPGTENLVVVGPDGRRHRINLDSQGLVPFAQTQEIGYYEVRDSERVLRRFAVNLFDERESDIALRASSSDEETSTAEEVASLEIGYENVAAEAGWEPVRRELWRWLLLAALAVLLFEWYIYNRRVYL